MLFIEFLSAFCAIVHFTDTHFDTHYIILKWHVDDAGMMIMIIESVSKLY